VVFALIISGITLVSTAGGLIWYSDCTVRRSVASFRRKLSGLFVSYYSVPALCLVAASHHQQMHILYLIWLLHVSAMRRSRWVHNQMYRCTCTAP